MSNKRATLTASKKEKIRNQFVQGVDDEYGDRVLFSLEELATQYKVGKSTLYRHARKELWKMQQEKFQMEFLTELDEKRKSELVKESKQFDRTTLNIAKAMIGQVGILIRKAQADDKFTPNMLSQLAESTYKIQRVAKLALGEATDNMNLNARVQDTTAFREAMELLDEVADQRRESDSQAIH